jgi:hypothetical protein
MAEFLLRDRRLSAAIAELHIKDLSSGHVDLDAAVVAESSRCRDKSRKVIDHDRFNGGGDVALLPAFNTDTRYRTDTEDNGIRIEAGE